MWDICGRVQKPPPHQIASSIRRPCTRNNKQIIKQITILFNEPTDYVCHKYPPAFQIARSIWRPRVREKKYNNQHIVYSPWPELPPPWRIGDCQVRRLVDHPPPTYEYLIRANTHNHLYKDACVPTTNLRRLRAPYRDLTCANEKAPVRQPLTSTATTVICLCWRLSNTTVDQPPTCPLT